MIVVENLYYTYGDQTLGLDNLNFELPSQSRTLLLGANGAGKSTLLRVLAGKKLAKAGSILIDGRDPFREGLQNATYLGTEFVANPTVRRDITVPLLIKSVGGDYYPERRDMLIDILDIDLQWHMNAVSDGERRRVQLCMGLLKPFDLLLLDEVTVDLDVLVRQRLLDFLKTETETRNCQIVYATHIFDGLMGWPTHLAHMHVGQMLDCVPLESALKTVEHVSSNSALLDLALDWLKTDLTERPARGTKRKTWDEINSEDVGVRSDQFGAYFKATRH